LKAASGAAFKIRLDNSTKDHTMIPHDTINKLEETWTSISEFCAALTEQQWKTASQLPAWTVQDNLSHMVGTESGLEGNPRTEHKATDTSHIRNPIGEMNEHDVDSRRSMSGAAVLAEWNTLTATRLHTLKNADDAYFEKESFTPTGPGTLADFLHIRVLDCWVHEQDMRRAVNMPGHQGGPSAEHTIDRLIRTVPIVVGKRAATPEGGTVVVVITGAVQRTVVTTIVDGRAQLAAQIPTEVLTTITMDSDTFVQLATGRATHEQLAPHITTNGDTELATRVVSQFNMMI
jgi:uncharacterized protein (TIGR03083 family)